MRALVAVVPLLAGCALVTLASKQRSWPDLAGDVPAGVSEPVAIHRDALGVPHVRAADAIDAAYALGYAMGQDRLFQADLNRRLGWGGLSELLGPQLAPFDAFLRALGFQRKAERWLADEATPEERATFVAFAQGINDAAASRALPVEHRLLGVAWEPWEPVDSLAVAYSMSWALAENPAMEIAALELRGLPTADLDLLLRTTPEDPEIDAYWEGLRSIAVGPYTPTFVAYTRLLGGNPSGAEASNNWVIGPSKSRDGEAIVANDPHLQQRVPSIWYAADVRAGDTHVAGLTLPGSPAVIIGHNGHVAWGLTNTMADVVDLVVLERDGADRYVLAGESKALEALSIDVPVKGGRVETVPVWMTEVGPLVTEPTPEATHLVALRWHAAEVQDESALVFTALARARTVAEAKEAFRRPLIVSQNLVLADTEGTIAWQVVGSLVRRKNHTGRVPYPGSDPAFGWQGWLEHGPGVVDPVEASWHTANNRPDDPLASAISTAYVPSHRADRIGALLAASDDWTPEAVARMQLDTFDGSAGPLLDAMLPLVSSPSEAARPCHEALLAWDRDARPDAVGPTVFAAFQRALVREALVDEIGEEGLAMILRVQGSGRSVLQVDPKAFLEDPVGGTDRALAAACADLAARFGPDPAGWAWGEVHPLAIDHPFGRRAKALEGWNMESAPWGGSGASIMAAGYPWSSDDWSSSYVQSVRIVMPLGDLGASTVTYPGGQSGHPGSPTYRSHHAAFVAGETLPLWFDDEDVAAHTVETLRLVPR